MTDKETVLAKYPDADWISVKDAKPGKEIAVVAKVNKKWTAIGEGDTKVLIRATASAKISNKHYL